MPPEIMQTALLDKWVIVTRKTVKDGVTIAHNKFYIPDEIIEQIANSYLIKQLDGCEKGYTYKTGKEKEIKVTVELINEVKS